MLPEDLVAVDSFVRRGGAVLIFADGLLSWPSAFPVGDSRNPPVTSLLSPLLDHWGVTLDAPAGLRQEPVDILDGLMRLALFSPGRLRVAADSPCRVGLDGLVANCRIGRGRVSIIADADMLNDTHYKARQSLVEVPSDKWPGLMQQNIFPKLSATPGAIRWAGPTELGSHTEEVLTELLDLTPDQIAKLRASGIV